MTQLKDTQDIGKKFKDVFAGAFPEGTSLEDKVKIINEFRQELKAYKRQVTKENLEKRLKDISAADNFSLEDKIKTIAKLNRSLRDRMNRAVKKVAKDFEKIVELNRELKDVFPENSSLEDKVKIIVELHRELKAQKGRKDEVEIIKKLIHNLEGRMDRAAKKIAEDFKKIAGFKQKFEGKDVFTSKKVAEFESNKKSQTTLEGKISDQNKQEKTSVQTDKIRDSVSKIDTPGRAISENKNFEQEKTSVQTDKIRDSVSEADTSEKAVSEDKNFEQEKISVQTDTVQPSVSKDPIKDKPSDKKPKISLKQVSVDRNATEKKSNNKKSQLSEKKNIAQPKENQKEEGFLVRFLKKIFKKLFGEDKKSVEDIKGTTQKSTSNDEGQQQNKLLSNQDQSASEGLKQIDNPLVTPVTKVEKTKTDHER
ncbi:hypothetical protein WSTR_04780 [Wolbachia endosymbiont of Laodelphax striatellus]|uniref:hypothetical protein n=1 Tax=Wolbachia endosymbiont of Laodelphax striatellus TaxID=368602 RepID=UPI0007C4E7D3|nr:hypothetical protein [Wolbachia endosymbiont of Laodelphax striatellus]OAB80967.1 hypothetical protein WSTR_04780 [Wolbachia endosymbiont of Laodelphax striatellus]